MELLKTDIEIAQSVEMEPITKIAERAGIDEEYLEEERTDLSPVQLPENRDCRAVNLAEKIYAHYDVCSGSSGNAGSEGFSSEKSGGENHEI